MDKQLTKRQAWELMKKQDGFFVALAKAFGCSGVKIKGKKWGKVL